MKDWIKFSNNPQRCHSKEAWEEDENSKPDEYHSCTLSIAETINLNLENIKRIQEIGQLDEINLKRLEDDVWLSFEDMTFTEQQDESKDFKMTLHKIGRLHNEMDKPWTY